MRKELTMKLTLQTTLADILSASILELPETPDLHSQLVTAAYKLMIPISRENLLEDLQAECDDEYDGPLNHWVKANPDRISDLLDLWQTYKDNGADHWQALYQVLNEL